MQREVVEMARFVISAFSDEASRDIGEQIAACKQNKVTHMELRGINGKNISLFSVDEAKELKKTLDEAEMQVSSIGSFYGKIAITDDFEPHFEAFKNTVEVAKILEAEYIRIFSFYFSEDYNYEEYKDEVFSRLKRMAECAQKKGIFCCHENEKGIYGDTAERCLEILEGFEDELGGIFDPANFIQCGVDPLAAYEMLEPYIEYMHIKDAVKETGMVVPAGEGDGNVEEILRRFTQKDGIRFLSVEPHLKVFDGLKNLEQDDKKTEVSKFIYPDNKSSFAAACSALHALVEKVQPVRFGIIGIGNMGSSHFNYYFEGRLKEMRLTAVADIDPSRLEAVRERLPGILCFNTAEELMDSGECDAVIIATPHYFHPTYSVYALNKGLHVMTEKPAGVYTKQVREANEAAAKSDKVYAIMYNQRTNGLYRKLRKMVQSGEFGEIRRVNWIITNWYRTQAYYNSGGWRATWSGEGGGVLLNQCPHNLDLWQWICGMPVKILAVCHEGKWHDIEVEDDVTIYAEYANGATGVFITSTGDAPGTNRLEITMDGGHIVCENGKLSVYKLNESTKEHCANSPNGFGAPKGAWSQAELDGHNEQHIGVLNAFAANILRGEPLYARGEEGINGLSISNAAHLSSWLGRPVELPVDEDLFYNTLQEKIANSKTKKESAGSVAQNMADSFGN